MPNNHFEKRPFFNANIFGAPLIVLMMVKVIAVLFFVQLFDQKCCLYFMAPLQLINGLFKPTLYVMIPTLK